MDEPRVLGLDEIYDADILWYESEWQHESEWGRAFAGDAATCVRIVRLGQIQTYEAEDDYGVTWRCWDRKPSPNQRKAQAWIKT